MAMWRFYVETGENPWGNKQMLSYMRQKVRKLEASLSSQE
jgi:hypothetical protein